MVYFYAARLKQGYVFVNVVTVFLYSLYMFSLDMPCFGAELLLLLAPTRTGAGAMVLGSVCPSHFGFWMITFDRLVMLLCTDI